MRPNNVRGECYLEKCIVDNCKKRFLFIMFCTCSCRREICHGGGKFAEILFL